MSFVLGRNQSLDCEVGEGDLLPHLPSYQEADLHNRVTYEATDLHGVTYTNIGDTDLVRQYHNSGEVDLVTTYGSSYSGSGSYDDGSFDGDRPHSRLTIIESPTPSFDQDQEEDLSHLSHFSLESPEPESTDYLEGHLSGRNSVHTCEECHKTFTSPGKLKQHEYTHTGETPFECKISGCDKKFTSKFKLKRHVLIHSQTKTFHCDVCKRAFRRKDHLKNHEKVHDPGKTVYSCNYDTCGRTYNSISSFRKHQAMHCAEEGQLDCKICKLVLATRDELINHLKVHAGSRTVKGSNDKKFECNECVKKFFTKKDLKRHSVVHTGNREFSCPHCTQRFGRKDHMTRHAKKTHASLYEAGSVTRERSGGGQRTRYVSTPGQPPVRPVRTQRKERSISDPGPIRVPDVKQHPEPSILEDEESKTKTVGLPRNVIVHHSSTRGTTEQDTEINDNNTVSRYSAGQIPGGMVYSGGSVTYCDQYDDNVYRIHQDRHLSPPTGEFQKMMSLESAGMVIKEEEDGYYNDQDIPEPEENAIRELLGVRDRIDISSLMQEFSEKKTVFLPPPSPTQDSMVTQEMEEIKMEPTSPPPCTSPIEYHQNYYSDPGQEPPQMIPLQPPPPVTSNMEHSSSKPRNVFMRTPSQDSITRTKNPVLPSIHTETCLLVPEPNSLKYPASSGHTQLLFTAGYTADSAAVEEREVEELTELRGSLFLSDEYGQHYFQPWN